MVEATPKRVFGNAHTYHINSISLNSDQETFLSADDLRINLWHTEVTDQSFSKSKKRDRQRERKLSILILDIVDIKPPNMEDLTEVITGAEFHPRECNLFVYSSSRGIIRLCDMRQSALCDRHCKGKATELFLSLPLHWLDFHSFRRTGRSINTKFLLGNYLFD